jgi:hypothetical protein
MSRGAAAGPAAAQSALAKIADGQRRDNSARGRAEESKR